ncbi:hypothetical protein T492DRAFT_904134 [Pavlovales sp. CCMP2436]|nr:hypothetical protein T492DRAFT_904134 [Pavlovales sp. CCMP2436]
MSSASRSSSHPTPRTVTRVARLSSQRRVRIFNFGAALVRAATLPPSDVLHLSGMLRKKSHREARDHRKAAGVSPIEHIEHLEKRWIDLAAHREGAWHKADIKRGAQTKAVNLAQSQHITLEEAQSLVAQHRVPVPDIHLLRTHRPLVRTALHIPPDGAVPLRNFKVVHPVPTNTWSVIRWQYN